MTTIPDDLRVAAAKLVARTTSAQGLPLAIVDPAALARAAACIVPVARVKAADPAPRHIQKAAGTATEAA